MKAVLFFTAIFCSLNTFGNLINVSTIALGTGNTRNQAIEMALAKGNKELIQLCEQNGYSMLVEVKSEFISGGTFYDFTGPMYDAKFEFLGRCLKM